MSIYSFNEQKKMDTKTDEVQKVQVGDEVKGSIKDIAEQEGRDNGKEKVVIIDGPLSHVYTQALNIALANESVMVVAANTPSAQANKESVEESNPSFTGEKGKDAEYIYVLGDKIDSESHAMEAYNAVSAAVNSGKYAKVHLALEGATSGKMTKRLGIVMEGAMLMGVNVVAKPKFGSSDAVQSLKSSLRK